MSYFPLFLDLSDRTVFVAGGGTIAERRIRAILPFVREIVVAAEKPSESLLRFAEEQAGRLRILEKNMRRTMQLGHIWFWPVQMINF